MGGGADRASARFAARGTKRTGAAGAPDAAAKRAGRGAKRAPDDTGRATGNAPMQDIVEVRNRFRLFREERDFLLHVESAGAAACSLPSRRWNCRATAAAGRATW